MNKLELTDKDRIRFFSKIERLDNGCWIWKDSPGVGGYGKFYLRGKQVLAHRVSYFSDRGEPGIALDHLCRNRLCVNPEHLESVSYRTNLLRGKTLTAANAAKTHCPVGHIFDAVTKKNQRRCKACNRAREERKRRASGKPILKRVDAAMKRAICTEYAAGGMTTRQLGEKHGIDYGYIARIIRSSRSI